MNWVRVTRASSFFIFCVWGILSTAAASAEELQSPVYIDYNTFIDRVNILELVSVGEDTLEVDISIYRNTGALKLKRSFEIEPLNQFDVLINDLVNDDDTYGLIKIEFDDINSKLTGRMAVYRANRSTRGIGDFSFAFAKELRNAQEGTSYVTGNSFDAQGRGLLVPNWLEISNLEDSTKSFTHRLYDANGTLLSTQMVSVPPKGKVDVSSGHERGEGLFLNEIIPADVTADYLASVTRYASNSRGATSNSDYAYAFSAYAKSGEGADQYAFNENRVGNCYEQTAWIEIANVGTTTATATLTFYDNERHVLGTSSRAYPAKSQFHFYGTALLDEGDFGFVKVESDTANAFLVQSAVYFHSCSGNTLQTAYLLPGQVVQTPPLVGSYNLFLGQESELFIIPATTVNRNLDMTLNSGGAQVFADTTQLRPNELLRFQLDDNVSFNTTDDTYGTILLDTLEIPSHVPFVLRTRRSGSSSEIVDYVMPTLFGERPED